MLKIEHRTYCNSLWGNRLGATAPEGLSLAAGSGDNYSITVSGGVTGLSAGGPFLPFLFFIVEQSTGAILFEGCYRGE